MMNTRQSYMFKQVLFGPIYNAISIDQHISQELKVSLPIINMSWTKRSREDNLGFKKERITAFWGTLKPQASFFALHFLGPPRCWQENLELARCLFGIPADP